MASERQHRDAIDRVTKRIREQSRNEISAEKARDRAVEIAKRHERVVRHDP